MQLPIPRKNAFFSIGVYIAFAVFMAVIASNVAPAAAATITIVNLDPAGVGLNDPTPATAVGGNTGTTKGEQAQIVFNRAAEIWEDKEFKRPFSSIGALPYRRIRV